MRLNLFFELIDIQKKTLIYIFYQNVYETAGNFPKKYFMNMLK